MRCCTSGDDYVYVILPYFNFCGYTKRRQLFIDFIQRMKMSCHVRIVIVEATSAKPLPTFSCIYNHIKVKAKHPIWVKESLINIGIDSLPDSWKYVAWIDADITFQNKTWAEETIEELQTYDVVQLFQDVAYLGPRDEVIKMDKSFGYMHRESNHSLHKTDKYGFWHPGFAWACTRRAWKTMGKLLDWAPLGSADRHMATAFVGKVDVSAPRTIHENYKALLLDFEKSAKTLRLSYIPGRIVHHWHGSLENRKYRERWNILVHHAFDPLKDVEYCNGVLQLTQKGQRMEADMGNYFLERKEDE